MSKNKKKNIIILSVILAVIAVVVYYSMSLISEGRMSLRSPVRVLHNPKVTWAQPEAEMKSADSEDWIEVEPGLKLSVDSFIRTGPFGNVDISFSEGTLIRVAENTVVSLSDLSLSKTDVSLEEGSLISKFSKITGNEIHTIMTPEVVCGIRGTELIVEIRENETIVYGMSGVTEVSSVHHPEDSILLGFQQKTIAADGEMPELAVKMTTEEVSRFRRTLDSMHSSEVFFITSDLKFEPDSAELVSDSMEMLHELAATINIRRLKIEIVGHTAEVGNSGGQHSLSKKRAETVKDALVSMGVKEKNLTTTGYGASKPIADNSTEEGRALNRRVEFLIRE